MLGPFYDINVGRSRYISRRELRTGLFSLNVGLSLLQVDDLVDLADHKHDGQIDFGRFRNQLGNQNTVARGVARTQAEIKEVFSRSGINLKAAFRAFDRDGDGVISRYEFGSGLRQLNLGLSAAQMDDVIAHVDKDGDGQIDYAEFVRQYGAPSDNRQPLQQVHDEVRALLRRKRAVGGWYRVLAAFEADADGRLTKQAFHRGWAIAGLNLTERQVECAFMSLAPDAQGCVTTSAFARKYGQAGAATTNQLHNLANKLCDLIRTTRANPRLAFGLSSASTKSRKATFSPQEIRTVLKTMRIDTPAHVDIVIDLLDPDGENHISSTSLSTFLNSLANYGVAREIIVQMRDKMRTSFEARKVNATSTKHEGWLTSSELATVLGSVKCSMRSQTIARLVGTMTDESGRVNFRAFINEMSHAYFVVLPNDSDNSSSSRPARSELATLAFEVRRRVMHVLNGELMRNGQRSGNEALLLDADALEAACRGLNITVASSRIAAFCKLGKLRDSIDALTIAPNIVCADSHMSRAATILSDEIIALVDATKVDAYTLFSVMDCKQQGHISLKNFISGALQLGVEMTHTEIQDAWSMLTKGAMTQDVFIHNFGKDDLERKLARVFSRFLSDNRITCHDVFTQVDVHRTGHVLRDDMRAALQALQTNISEPDMIMALERIRLDRHGMITFAAFAMSLGTLRSTAALIRKAFRRQHGVLSMGVLQLYDRDYKGWMSIPDVFAMFSELGLELAKDCVDEVVDAVDKSRDGRVQFSSLMSVVGVFGGDWAGSSLGAVRTFRKEIVAVLKRHADDAEKVFSLFCDAKEVSFQWKNSDFLLKNPDFMFRNPDFPLKHVDFVI